MFNLKGSLYGISKTSIIQPRPQARSNLMNLGPQLYKDHYHIDAPDESVRSGGLHPPQIIA